MWLKVKNVSQIEEKKKLRINFPWKSFNRAISCCKQLREWREFSLLYCAARKKHSLCWTRPFFPFKHKFRQQFFNSFQFLHPLHHIHWFEWKRSEIRAKVTYLIHVSEMIKYEKKLQYFRYSFPSPFKWNFFHHENSILSSSSLS